MWCFIELYHVDCKAFHQRFSHTCTHCPCCTMTTEVSNKVFISSTAFFTAVSLSGLIISLKAGGKQRQLENNKKTI